MNLKFLATLFVALAAAAWWMDWIPFLPRNARAETPPPSAKVVRASVKPVLPLAGQITPAFQVEVKPEIGGKVATIHVQAGQEVKKGEPLVTIDDTDLLNERAGVDAEIEGARLAVDRIRGNYQRAEKLFAGKLLSKEEFVNLEADWRIAENDLERSRRRRQLVDDRISKTRILAPFDGTILQIPIIQGQVVVGAASINSGTNLMTLADLSRLLINAHVNQLDAGKLSTGQRMSVTPPDGEPNPADDGQGAEAVVSFIAPLATVKNNIKGFEVTGTLEGTRDGLKPGVSVSMSIPLGTAENVLTVPITAVFEEKGTKVVYVQKESRPERREISIGLSDLSLVEIQSGLSEGEEILLAKPDMPEKTRAR
jgi:RND family efflux transporter MFP subunit